MIIYCTWIFRLPMVRNYDGITLFPFIFIRKPNNGTWSSEYIRYLKKHEQVHFKQQLACLVVGFYVIYLINFLWLFLVRGYSRRFAYHEIWFEQQARRIAGI
jgi:hypothetical protein